MGLLIEHTPHRDAQYDELSFAIPTQDGEAYAQLTLEQRDALYQAVLDAIRSPGAALLALSVDELQELLGWDEYVEQEGGFATRSANPLRDKIEATIATIKARNGRSNG